MRVMSASDFGEWVAWAWSFIPPYWRAPATIATLVGSLLTVLKYLRAIRPLQVSLAPDPWGQRVGAMADQYRFSLTTVNPATSFNSIQEVRCWLDGREVQVNSDPDSVLRTKIEGGMSVRGCLTVPASELVRGFDKIEFLFVPVRGRPRRFRFLEPEVLPEF